jgi:hypothetical protein
MMLKSYEPKHMEIVRCKGDGFYTHSLRVGGILHQ